MTEFSFNNEKRSTAPISCTFLLSESFGLQIALTQSLSVRDLHFRCCLRVSVLCCDSAGSCVGETKAHHHCGEFYAFRSLLPFMSPLEIGWCFIHVQSGKNPTAETVRLFQVFVIAILFPLFSVPFLLYLFLRMRNRDKMDRRREAAGYPMLDLQEERYILRFTDHANWSSLFSFRSINIPILVAPWNFEALLFCLEISDQCGL